MAKKKRPKSSRGPSAAKEFASKSRYLKGSDIKETFDAVISKLEKVKFDNGMKWVAHLEGKEKSIVLNQTSGNSLRADFGDDMGGWKGQLIHVSTQMRQNPTSGQMGPAVAVCGASEDIEDDTEDYSDIEDDDDLE